MTTAAAGSKTTAGGQPILDKMLADNPNLEGCRRNIQFSKDAGGISKISSFIAHKPFIKGTNNLMNDDIFNKNKSASTFNKNNQLTIERLNDFMQTELPAGDLK